MKAHLLALGVIVTTVAIGLGLAALSGPPQPELFGLPILIALALLAFAVQWLVYLPSFLAQTEHYYDLTGSATYLLLIVVALAAVESPDARGLLLAALVLIWALRLGSFLFRRVKRAGKDGRFDEIKPRWSRFLVAWTLQGLWVFLTLLAALIAITAPAPQALGPWAALGLAVWLLGFGCEAVADAQKSRFAADPANRGRFIQSGLWAWSRHPNYFGEITLWVGVAIIAAPLFSGWQWLGLLSPVFVAFLLIRVSGIPLLEKRADEKWGDQPDYQAYKARTPVLLPRPPRGE